MRLRAFSDLSLPIASFIICTLFFMSASYETRSRGQTHMAAGFADPVEARGSTASHGMTDVA